MEQAIEFEARRQIELLEDGKKVEQETRLYDPERNETRSMRSKEDAHDYRYFPDPDLLPLVVSEKMIQDVRKTMPELPEAKRRRYVEKGVTAYTANLLTATRDRAEYFEKAISLGAPFESTANVVVGQLASLVNDAELPFMNSLLTPGDLATLQKR